MTVDGRKSPVHVHVDRETPVHVHLKKKKKGKPGVPTAVEQRLKSKKMSGFGKSSVLGPRRSKKSPSPPFIPPPGRTTKRPLTWEGSSHRLEISPQIGSGTMKMTDLSTSEEEEVQGKVRTYEKRIGSLMSEVGTLKNEMDLRRVRHAVEKKDEQLDASRRLLETQEDELLGYKHELKATVKENEALRHSVEKWREDADVTRSEVGKLAGERTSLLKKLVEVEMDGKAAGEHVQKLRDTVRKLKEDKRMSAADTTMLTRQREMLMQKLDEFERTNKALRRLLREQQATEGEYDHLRKQQDVLIKRLTESDTTNERFQVEVAERDRQIESLLVQVEADKDQAVAFEELKKTMETTRAHLQNQLRSKEMDCGRLAVQSRSMEDQLEQARLEVEHLQGLLAVQREKSGREKDALKKAARLQKDRVGNREKDLEVLKEKLEEQEMDLNETKRAEVNLKDEKATADVEIRTLKSRVKELQEYVETTEKTSHSNSEVLTTKLSTRTQEVNTFRLENEQLKADIAALEERLHEEEQRAVNKAKAVQSKMSGLLVSMKQYDEIVEEYKRKVELSEGEVNELHGSVNDYRARVEEYRHQHRNSKDEVKKMKACAKEYEDMLQEYKNQVVSYEAEINNLRATINQNKLLMEDSRNRCNFSVTEITELKGAVKQYEEVIKEYKVQIDKYRREAEDAKGRLYEYEADTQRLQQESAIENEKVKLKMQQRLSELEPLADLLKTTDVRLHESQERIFAYERRSSEHTKLISELTQKVEIQTDQLEHMREKLRAAQEDTRAVQAKSELIERKLTDSDQQNRELIGVISKKEESLYQTQQRHEDLRAENIRLNQQLESSIAEAKRQSDSQREKALVKERAAQARITDLETQLSRATASSAQLKRSKDEAERRYNSKLYDMRDRLDQANSTTRSMQNYVSFLKSSYANVFDEIESPR